MKIDSHVHVTPPDIIADWKKYAEKEPYFSLISNSKVNKFATAEDVATVLDKDNFDKAVVFGFGFNDIGLCRYVNDYVIEKVKQFPEKLIGFAVAPPNCKETRAEIERCCGAGLKGVGELFPQGQGIDLVNENNVSSIAGTCKELDIPLLLHVNESVGHYYPGKTNVPLQNIEKFVLNNPGLKIILAHFGGGIFIYETMKEIKAGFRNVYYDTAVAPYLFDARIYDVVKALNICDRILFGSDFPILPPSRYFKSINASSLNGEEKDMILGLNTGKLLGILS
ncbi:MAG: amidohydrolase [Treponema sp.]|nr:amidohydrolase [Treponema sp.]